MQVAIRADSSVEMGSGHLMRCLSLAERMRSGMGAEVHFVSRDLAGSVHGLASRRGFALHVLPCHADVRAANGLAIRSAELQRMDAEETRTALQQTGTADLLIVDHYGMDEAWERHMRPCSKKILVIDDLANRRHDCEFLLDQTYGIEGEERYAGLVPSHCRMFLGVSYALLGDAYYKQKSELRRHVKKILVFYGGSDDTMETIKFLTAWKQGKDFPFQADVIVGEGNPQKREIKNLCDIIPNVSFHCQVGNMAEFIAEADLAFGAAGSNTWERCILGLPTIVTVTADNQRRIAQKVSETGAIRALGWHEDVTADSYETAIGWIPHLALSRMSEAAYRVMEDNRKGTALRQMLEELA